MRSSAFSRSAAFVEGDLLPPDRARRQRARLSPQVFVEDVEEAHFVVVGEPASQRGTARLPAEEKPPVPSGVLRLSQRLCARLEARLQQLSDLAFALLVALVFGAIFSFASQLMAGSGDHLDIVARPLDLTHVNLTTQDRNGMRVLVVNAIIENRSTRRVALPMIRADLLVDGQVVASTYVQPPDTALNARQSRGLTTRLQHPGGKDPVLRLSFAAADASAS